jgi:hypothetical protein
MQAAGILSATSLEERQSDFATRAEHFHYPWHCSPLSDLLTDDPGQTLLAGVTSGGQVGMATIDGGGAAAYPYSYPYPYCQQPSGPPYYTTPCPVYPP